MWNSAGWLEEVTEWVDGALRSGGRARTSGLERWRVTRWSALLTADTASGPV